MDGFYFNDIAAGSYGITFLEDSYKELRKPAKMKEGTQYSWPDEHGTERDVATRFLESRTLTLPVLVEGVTEKDFSEKLLTFMDWIANAGYFKLKVERLNRIYTLLYSDATDYKDYYTHCTFNLILLDDSPATVKKIIE